MENIVKEIISKQLNIDIKNINYNDDIIEKLGADSLDIVEMLVFLEDNYGISIDDSCIPNLRTTGDIINILKTGTEVVRNVNI